MKKKSLFYLIMGIVGIALIVSAFLLDGRVTKKIVGVLAGAGTGLTGIGIVRWRLFRWGMKYPAKWKQREIESNDERNVIIKFRAKAVAGEILHWMVMAAVWVAIFLDAALWVILAIDGVFLFKSILELCLMVRYQKEM